MSWIGLRDHEGAAFSLAGIAAQSVLPPSYAEDALLREGSLMLEFSHVPSDRKRVLLDHKHEGPTPFRLSLVMMPNAHLHLAIICGDRKSGLVMETGLSDVADSVELVISWQADEGVGLVSLSTGRLLFDQHRVIRTPPALPVAALEALVQLAALPKEMAYLAVSSQIVPTGPAPGLSGAAVIETTAGRELLSRIRKGDVVLDHLGRKREVLWSGFRDVPARGRYTPVRLRAPYFGLSRDLVAARFHLIGYSGPDVEYLFGEELVLAPTGQFATGARAREDTAKRVVRYHQILLEDHAILRVDGLLCETLYVERLAKSRIAHAASLWSGSDTSAFPIHNETAAPVLKPFETVTLTHVMV